MKSRLRFAILLVAGVLSYVGLVALEFRGTIGVVCEIVTAFRHETAERQ